MHLRSNIYSAMVKGKLEGRKGESITVIAIHHIVAIVEGDNNNRFAAPVELLSEVPVSHQEPIAVNQIVKPQPVRKLRKAITNTNPSLF